MFCSICWVRPSAPRHSRVEPVSYNTRMPMPCHSERRETCDVSPVVSTARVCAGCGDPIQPCPGKTRRAYPCVCDIRGDHREGWEISEKKRKRTQKATILRELTLTFKASTPCRLVRALLGRMATMSRASWRAHSAR